MKRYEELIFGIKRYLLKSNKYINGLTDDEFFSDELRFDALCFCIYMINDIANEGKNIKEFVDKVGIEETNALCELKNSIFVGDHISLDDIYDFAKTKSLVLLMRINENLKK